MNRGLLFVVALIVAITLPLAITGQEKKDSGSVSVTGCFNKGADAVMPGDKFEIAVFGINGPISIAPSNTVWFREAKIEFYR